MDGVRLQPQTESVIFIRFYTEFLGDLMHLSSTSQSISVSLHLLNTKPLYWHDRNIMRKCIIMMKRYGKVNNIHILLDCDFQLLPCETPIGYLALNNFCIHHHIGQQPPHVFTVHTPSRENSH